MTDSHSTSSKTVIARACIRFGHIDGARIVFYPRYFELLAQYFNDLSFAVPCKINTLFRKPNRLADRIDLKLTTSKDSSAWCAIGEIDGVEYFRITSTPLSGTELQHVDLPDADKLYHGAEQIIGAWMVDQNGVLNVSRYYELVNDAVERWFEELLGSSFQADFTGRGIGIPTVRLTTRCFKLPSIDMTVVMRVRPLRLGTKSLLLRHTLLNGSEVLLVTDQTVVFIETVASQLISIAIPGDIRRRIESQNERIHMQQDR